MTARRAWGAVAGGVAIGLYLHHVALFWPQINDDAWITYRYSHFLAQGRGPYFNPGEHVEGYTNFLLMLLLAGVDAILGLEAVPAASKVFGAAGGCLAVAAASLLAASWLRQIEPLAPWAGLLGAAAGALVADNAGFVINSTTGLETTLFAGLITLGLLLIERGRVTGRWRGAGIPFALAALTRPEGTVVFAGALAGGIAAGEWRGVDGRRRLVRDTLIVGATVVAHLGFRLVAYGDFLPNTYYAKAGGAWGATPRGYLLDFAWQQLTPFLAPLCLLPLLTRAGRRAAFLPASGALAAAIFAIFWAGTDWMEGFRLLCPYAPAWAALAVAGLAALLERFTLGAFATGLALAASVAGASLWQAPALRDYQSYVGARSAAMVRGHVAVAEWIGSRAAPGQTVALMDIGLIGVRLIELRILDVSGLTDRHIARLPGGFLNKSPDAAYVLGRRPEFVVLTFASPAGRPEKARSWSPMERAILESPAFQRDYARPREAGRFSETETLAALLSADHVFDATPVRYRYFLAVFTRKS